ncbi:MAG: hypothetical protein OQJ98_01770 [Candidatus Pacebacteria bacterium]|nr:hypothetical protein [Candidatus Paceibacterota bacterium]
MNRLHDFRVGETVVVKEELAAIFLNERDKRSWATILKVERRRGMHPLLHLRFPTGTKATIYTDGVVRLQKDSV